MTDLLKPSGLAFVLIIFLPISAEHELRCRVGIARVVAAMDHRMAVQTASSLGIQDTVLAASGGGGQIAVSRQLQHLAAMRGMALVAKHGRTHLEHRIGGGAVRVVAVRAVILHRRMVMHEGAALFHVAHVAGLIDAIALQLLGPGGAVRVVAIRTGHLAFRNGVVRRTVHLRTLLLVACVADVGLGASVASLVVTAVMDIVTTGAGHATVVVGAAFPEHAVATLVAGGAGFILDIGRGGLLERPIGSRPQAIGTLLHVCDTLAVAVGATRRAAVRHGAVLGLADRQYPWALAEHGRLGIIGVVVAGRALGISLQHRIALAQLARLLGRGLGCETHDGQDAHQCGQPRPDVCSHVISP
jgi:hypothetical protein